MQIILRKVYLLMEFCIVMYPLIKNLEIISGRKEKTGRKQNRT
jgi:hypothetical protein